MRFEVPQVSMEGHLAGLRPYILPSLAYAGCNRTRRLISASCIIRGIFMPVDFYLPGAYFLLNSYCKQFSLVLIFKTIIENDYDSDSLLVSGYPKRY